jgi:hypothetical protein
VEAVTTAVVAVDTVAVVAAVDAANTAAANPSSRF